MSDERVRLFVALELPGAIRDSLIAWRDRALALVRGMRPLSADALHVTMCFLGWQDTDRIGAIAAACAELSVQPAPRLALGDGCWLPPRRARVLAVELVDPVGALATAQARLSGLLAQRGFYQPEKRGYLAHVTVARVARGASVRGEPLEPVPPLTFEAPHLTLFRSRLSGGGARYEPLARIELVCPTRH